MTIDATTAAMSGMKSPWLFYLLLSVTVLLGTNVTYLAPVDITAVIETLHVSPSVAGLIVSAEMIAVSIAALLIAPVITDDNSRRIGTLAIIVTVLANAACLVSMPVSLFVSLRLVAGIGCGVVYGLCCYWCARSGDSVRAMGIALMVASLIVAGMMTFLPQLISVKGLRGLYLVMTVFTLLVLIVMAYAEVPHGAGTETDPGSQAKARRMHRCWVLPAILIAVACADASATMMWGFSDQIAHVRGYDPGTVAVILTVGTLSTIIGSLGAALFGNRFGIGLPLALGIFAAAAAAALTVLVPAPLPFGVFLGLFQLACFFVIPFAVGAGAAYDSSGHTATVVGATMLLAGSVSPMIGGLVFDSMSPEAVAWACVASCVLSGICGLAMRRVGI